VWPVSSKVFARARVFPSFGFEFWFDAYQRIVKTVHFGSGRSTGSPTSRPILAIILGSVRLQISRLVAQPVD